ncbi:ATG26 [[Candida] subhashii]|uniref:Sterol 3-beta-glucosyltransferase n=1 Tax=[Candida] subhashii TaxID=561895 RepID=A0A8J5QM09_9ASCO|nr:ATG26 [[Candida] subhashii]KAG7662797.1 ATG26 [[Candida] subhashii]
MSPYRRILAMGTFPSYSTLSFLRGIPDNNKEEEKESTEQKSTTNQEQCNTSKRHKRQATKSPERGSTDDELDEEDSAKLCDGSDNGNFFPNLLRSTIMCSGICSLTNSNRLSLDDVLKSYKGKITDVGHIPYEKKRISNDTVDNLPIDGAFSDLQPISEPNQISQFESTSTISHSPPRVPSATIQMDLESYENALSSEEIPSGGDSLESLGEFNTFVAENVPTTLISRQDSNRSNNVLSRLQQTVIQNLDPHLVKESFLTKFKSGGGSINDAMKNNDHVRIKVANKLQRTFGLSENDHFYGNYRSWLVKDVLLQGHLYLTSDSLMFFSYLPKSDELVEAAGVVNYDDSSNIIQKGNLGMKTGRYGDSILGSVLSHRYWAILRDEALSIYSSSTNLYFPTLIIDIKSCIYAEVIDKDKYEKEALSPIGRGRTDGTVTPTGIRSGYLSGAVSPTHARTRSMDDFLDIQDVISNDPVATSEEGIESSSNHVWFKLVTVKKTYKFQCDSLFVARKWCNNLTKLIFSLNNSNSKNEVLVKVPLVNIIEHSSRRFFTEDSTDDTKDEDLRDDDDPFCWTLRYHTNEDENSNRVKLKKRFKGEDNESGVEEVYFLFPVNGSDFLTMFEKVYDESKRTSKERESGRFKMFSDRFKRGAGSTGVSKSFSTLTPSSNTLVKKVIEMNNIEQSTSDLWTIPTPEKSKLKKFGKVIAHPSRIFSSKSSIDDSITVDPSSASTVRRYDTFRSELDRSSGGVYKASENDSESDLSIKSSKTAASCVWKRDNAIGKGIKKLSNITSYYFATPSHYQKLTVGSSDPYYVSSRLERSKEQDDFREYFSLNKDSKLIACYYCHLERSSIPVFGRIYVGESEVCFRSLLPGVSTTMIIPMVEIHHVKPVRGIKLAFSSMKLTSRGHNELQFEFSVSKSRNDCVQVILNQKEKILVKAKMSPESSEDSLESQIPGSRQLQDNKRDLEMAQKRISLARIRMFEDRLTTASGMDIPIILEDSPFLKTEMKPSTSYNITMLTIGSRGDVQPYIALGKGLMEEGHKVTIATHSEFGPWIKKHGLGFKEIAGEPAELMSFMVSHSSMSVTFLKDAQAKFGSWISELLNTSWEACQGCDILIESPSAMAGIHIAEALVVPYFRAFTMPWTKSKAYPNAFFVPDQRKGGSYNYLTHQRKCS